MQYHEGLHTSWYELSCQLVTYTDTRPEELFRRELRIRRESDGLQSTTTITAIHSLASVLYQQGSYSEAVELFREAVVARTARELDTKNAKLWLAATLFLQQADSKEAEELFQEYAAWARESRTSPHADISDSLYWTGRSMLARAEYAGAVEAFEESISIRTQLGSEDHSNAVHAKQLLRRARQRLEETQEATSG